MKKNKYEISIWEDVHIDASVVIEEGKEVDVPSHFEESKICIIGAHDMTDLGRAVEPKLVENVNGTSTLTFKMFYTYVDTSTGKKIDNPYIKLLVNERKVKCFWKNKWYNLVVKGIQEDSSGKSITYTCKDQFINELSKTGFELEFSNELMNNSGTIKELAERVVEGTDWQISSNTDIIKQELEEPVYELKNDRAFTTSEGVTILAEQTLLVYYSVIAEQKPYFQFYYAEGGYATESSTSMLVNNGNCYGIENVSYKFTKTDEQIPCVIISWTIEKESKSFILTPSNTAAQGFSVSERYRAKRYVKSQLTEFVNVVNQYCSVYSDQSGNKYYGYEKTITEDPTTITNTIANNGANGFAENDGWYCGYEPAMPFGHYPLLEEEVTNGNYPDSFLSFIHQGANYDKIDKNGNKRTPTYNPYIYLNRGISLNSSYYEEGFAKGEIYILRYKVALGRTAPYIEYVGKDDTSKNYLGNYSYDEETGYYKDTGYVDKDKKIGTGPYKWNSGKISYYLGQDYLNVVENDSEYVRYFFHPKIGTYTIDSDGNYKIATSCFDIESVNCDKEKVIVEGVEKEVDTGWLEFRMKCTTSVSQKDIAKNFGLLLYVYHSGWLQEIQFFKELYDDDGIRLEPNTINSDGVVKAEYVLFPKTELDEKDKEEEITYAWRGDYSEIPSDYIPQYPKNNFEKIRTIEAKQSNRFNILQSLAETFECYPIFSISNDLSTGKLIYKYGVPEKLITFKQNYGQEVGYGFIYGVDLKTISRTINSDQIVSKTIVSQNSNQYAPNGFCTIQRAIENETGSSYILNLDYYVNQGLINNGTLINDLYNTATGIGLYPKIKELDKAYNSSVEKNKGKKTALQNLETMLSVYDSSYQEALDTITAQKTEFKNYKKGTAYSYSQAQKYVQEHPEDDSAKQIFTQWANAQIMSKSYKEQKDACEKQIEPLKEAVKNAEAEQDETKDKIKELENNFFKKYSAFIQEGSWISEEYMDDNLYYLDALSVAYTSSRPQISYNISVLRLSALEEFKGKDFKLGDITYIEDTEFFGYKDIELKDSNGSVISIIKVPYQEIVTISEVTSNFDSPENDSFKVQNYKTQFEDLFQRITATTQSLQYAEGEYKKASGVVDENGNIKAAILSQSLATNQNIMINYTNNLITQDNTGITLVNAKNPAQQVKLTSGGIIFTTNNGESWNTGIDASGVRADALTAGSINTEKIMVYSGSYPTFRWSSSGIEAFAFSKDKAVDFTTLVKFDQYGLYGLQNVQNTLNDTNGWTPSLSTDAKSPEEQIWDIASFGLTWNGFFLKNRDGIHLVEISNQNDFRITQNGKERVKIGKLSDNCYGLRLTDSNNNITLETDDEGQLWLKDKLSIGKEIDDYKVAIGNLEEIEKENEIEQEDGSVLIIKEQLRKVFDANNTFKIYNDGSVEGTNSNFSNLVIDGDSILKGKLRTDGDAFVEGIIHAASGWLGDSSKSIIDGNGITIIGGAFTIKDKNNAETLLKYDSVENQLKIIGSGEFTGKITATDGEFNGTIKANSGLIGGFFIESNQLKSTDDAGSLTLDGKNGIITVSNIVIGEGAQIKNYLKIGEKAYIYNPDIETNENKFIQTDNFLLTDEGHIKVGEIEIIGKKSSLSGSGWSITPSLASFNQIAITNGVFKTGNIQTLGGSMFFKPSEKCIIQKTGEIELQEADIEKYEDCYVMLSEEGYNTVGPFLIKEKVLQISENEDYSSYTTMIYLCRYSEGVLSDNIIIGVNSGANNVTLNESPLIYKQSFSFIPINKNDNGIEFSSTPNLLLGDLSSIPPYSGYGLYCDNAYLKGMLSSEGDEFSIGINSLSTIETKKLSSGTVIIWGGAKKDENSKEFDIANAPFQITNDGKLYASQGVFEGAILSNSTIEGSTIRTAKIMPRAGDKGLCIYNTYTGKENKGIQFMRRENNDEKTDTVSLTLTDESFSIHSNNPFLKFVSNAAQIGAEAILLNVTSDQGQIGNLEFQNNSIFSKDTNASILLSIENDNINVSKDTLSWLNVSKIGTLSSLDFITSKDIYFGESDKTLAVKYQRISIEKDDGSEKLLGYDVYVQ